MRDLKGYGNQLPSVSWPDGARVAVSFVLNFEEGAEFSMADGDGFNEPVYEVIDQQATLDPCIDTHFEYGSRVGYWRVAQLAAQYGIPMTVSACGRAVERSPWLVQDAAGRGHEIAAHGYRWQTHAGMPIDEERQAIADTVRAIREAVGQPPVGWHTRSVSTENTRALLREQGFIYDSDAYNDDTPYFVTVDGGRHLVLPYAFDTNDMQFQNYNQSKPSHT
ncbi:MAG TPA: polysaccharide deacetylase family protein [Castellaniella sp.]|nr:polysaccharide deacetylase family protein [Castellaniella sp.]